jgi:Berberine and berberine like
MNRRHTVHCRQLISDVIPLRPDPGQVTRRNVVSASSGIRWRARLAHSPALARVPPRDIPTASAAGHVHRRHRPRRSVNHDGPKRSSGYSAPKLARLTAVKTAYDPDNIFHLNHHIKPASR